MQAELSKDLAKVLTAAQKQAKQNGDTYVGTDTLLRALLDNKDIASTLTEAGEPSHTSPSSPPEHTSAAACPATCHLLREKSGRQGTQKRKKSYGEPSHV